MIDFPDTVLTHRARYPLMQPQDYGKLAFQSAYGPEHMIADEKEAAKRILTEWQAVSESDVPCNPEPIGGGLCRFHLTGILFSEENAELLAALFMRSAREHTGTREDLEMRFAILTQLEVDGMGAWLTAYRRQGCPPVHHSDIFRKAYHPHYRVMLEHQANDLYAKLTNPR